MFRSDRFRGFKVIVNGYLPADDTVYCDWHGRLPLSDFTISIREQGLQRRRVGNDPASSSLVRNSGSHCVAGAGSDLLFCSIQAAWQRLSKNVGSGQCLSGRMVLPWERCRISFRICQGIRWQQQWPARHFIGSGSRSGRSPRRIIRRG